MGALIGRPAVGFSLTNADHEPTLMIGDGLASNVLSFVVTNQTAEPLALVGGTPVPDGQPNPDGPTTLYPYFGDGLTPAQVSALTITAPEWVATWMTQSGTWALTPTANGSLAAGGSVNFTITHVDVSGPDQDGHFTVDYTNLGSIPNGFAHLPLARRSADSGATPTLQLTVGFGDGPTTVVTTVDPDHPHLNSLTLQLSTNVANVGPTWDPASPPEFHLSFLYSESTPSGALTTRALAQKITVSSAPETAAAWDVDPRPTGEDPVWTLRPRLPGPILGPGSVVEFAVTGIESMLRPGPTQLSVAWTNVPGFAPGVAVAVIQKVAPLALGAISFDPSWIPAGQSIAPTLHWTTMGDPTTLELALPRDEPLDEAVATSLVSPVPIATTTVFSLRALRAYDDAVVVRSSTFPVFEFRPVSTGGIDCPGLIMGVWQRSGPNAVLVVFGGQVGDSIGWDGTASIMQFDGTTYDRLGQIDQVWPSDNSFSWPLLWINPNISPGVDRLAMATSAVVVVWDIEADLTATKRAAFAPPPNATFYGFRPTGTILAIVEDFDDLDPVAARSFTVLEFDPLGTQPARQLGPVLGGDGIFSSFYFSFDGEHIVYLGWVGQTPEPSETDDQKLQTPGQAVVRKTRLDDGALVDQVTIADTWLFATFLDGLFAIRFAELPDGSMAMYTPYFPDDHAGQSTPDNRTATSTSDPSTDPATDQEPDIGPPPGIVWMPLDGSGASRVNAPRGGSFQVEVGGEDEIPPQYSPNGTDVVIATKAGLWVAPSNRPELGVEVPIGLPLAPVVFSADGNVITAIVRDPSDLNLFEIVTLTRSLVTPTISLQPQ